MFEQNYLNHTCHKWQRQKAHILSKVAILLYYPINRTTVTTIKKKVTTNKIVERREIYTEKSESMVVYIEPNLFIHVVICFRSFEALDIIQHLIHSRYCIIIFYKEFSLSCLISQNIFQILYMYLLSILSLNMFVTVDI